MNVLLALCATLGLGLEVDAPPGCITALELEAAVEEEIGPFIADAQVRIEKIDSGWRAQINGSRTIEGVHRDCRRLDPALVLVVALMAERPRAEPLPPPQQHEEEQAAAVRFGLDAAIAVGALPDPSPGGRVSGAVGFPLGAVDLWIEAGFTGWRPSEMLVSQSSQTIESSTDRFDADLSLCVLAPLERAIELGGCAGARFGRLSVGGEINGTLPFDEEQTFSRGGEDARFLLAASAELRAAWKPIEEMALVLAAGASIELLDNAILVAGVPEISGNPSKRAYGIFRAGVQWQVW